MRTDTVTGTQPTQLDRGIVTPAGAGHVGGAAEPAVDDADSKRSRPDDDIDDDSWDIDEVDRIGRKGLAGQPQTFWAAGLTLAYLLVAAGVAYVINDIPTEKSLSPSEVRATTVWLAIGAVAVVLMCVGYLVRLAHQPKPAEWWSGKSDDLLTQLWAENQAMATYALRRGTLLKTDDLVTIEETRELVMKERFGTEAAKDRPESRAGATKDRAERRANAVKRLGLVHERLTDAVDPAMPRTLRLLNDPLPDPSERDPNTRPFPWLGNVRLVRMMVGVIVVLIPFFIALAISVGTNADSVDAMFNGDPIELFHTATYLFVASALGAAFAALFKAFKYIGNLSYDNKYESSYWMRFVLGLLAGVFLSLIFSRVFFDGETSGDSFRITVPLLALVGGFSSDLVYRMLNVVVEGITSMIRSSTDETTEMQEKEAKRELEKHDLEAKLELQKQEATIKRADDIARLRSTLPSGGEDALKVADGMLLEALGDSSTKTGDELSRNGDDDNEDESADA